MNFGTLQTTKVGGNLLAKAQLGAPLVFTKIKAGNGNLGSQNPILLTDLISPLYELQAERFKNLGNGKALVGTTFSNAIVQMGFYFRELGLFAIDPDLGEILYCYGNAGNLAEYISSTSSGEVIEKKINIISVVTSVQDVQIELDESLIYSVKFHSHDGNDESKIDAENVTFTDSSGDLQSTNVGDAIREVSGVVKDSIPLIEDAVMEKVDEHLLSAMPHRFNDNGTTYKWGLSVSNGILNFNYEEV